MAYLNREEREKLANELVTMNVGKARGKLRRMDANVKLRFIRNAQATGEYLTRLELPDSGVLVTLVERKTEAQTANDKPGSASVRLKPEFTLTEVVVDPTAENRT
ncbi:MAG: hypothetical protein IT319_06925 [Anaerolineae bacterium]|nr:hypothetical protein [Anaerolineae bacterium]